MAVARILPAEHRELRAASGPRRWLMIGLLFAAVLANYIDRGNLSIVAVPVMREFAISPAAMGTLLSAFFWSYALLQVPAGWIVDRFGLKWAYGGAFLLCQWRRLVLESHLRSSRFLWPA